MSIEERTDECLTRIRAGDTQALGALFELHRERLWRMLHVRLDRRLSGRVSPDDVLQDEALTIATQFAHGPTLAYGEIKRLFARAGAAHMESQLEDEAFTLARIAMTADAREGIAAMAERRKPVFRGR